MVQWMIVLLEEEMVWCLSYEPLREALQSISHPGHVVYLTPQGKKWDHYQARKWARREKKLSV